MTTATTTYKQEKLTSKQDALKQMLDELLIAAKKKGATSAEVAASIEDGFSATVRMREIDTIEYNRDKGISITVYFGQKKGSASTTDTSKTSLEMTLEKACNIAKFTGEDDCSGLADKEMLAFDYPDLQLYYPWDLSPQQAVTLALECEQQGLQHDKRLVNSEGASVNNHQSVYAYANSHGFIGCYATTRHGITLVLIGKDGSSMQRDYDYTVARDPLDLHSVKQVANVAATKTLKRLNARKIPTCKAPVIFHHEVATGLLGCFISAIRGGNLYRNSSFLVDHLHKPVFANHVQIKQSPHLLKALGSAPFDGEGVKTVERDLIKDGVLQSYVLSSYSARKLKMQTTGNAGGVFNLQINNNGEDLTALIKRMNKGLLVTELIGHGINIVTGDYSRGAAGFWVENGEIQYPVEEITIAGNLKDLFINLVAVANDTELRGNIRTGSILLNEMTIAGS